jgi:N-acetylglucosamine-6-phosphate deacetylase
MMVSLRNAQVLLQGRLERRNILLDGATIRDTIAPETERVGAAAYDFADCVIVPGFIDLHFHGAVGFDLMTADAQGLHSICAYQARHGTTSFFATTLTSTMSELLGAVDRIARFRSAAGTAGIIGLHIEGPYINPAQKGCHRIDWMRSPDLKDWDLIRDAARDTHLHFTVAPELDGAKEFIRAIAAGSGTISLGHTEATSVQCRAAIDQGATAFTHLFNAMRSLHHRQPGPVDAALAGDAYVELICDGIHVAPEIVNLVYRVKGADRIILVTDSMHAAGCGDGSYRFGGHEVLVRDGVARNPDGTLASSTITLLAAVKNFMRFTGASLEEVISMVTTNPARAVGMEGRLGAIAPGRPADLVVLNGQLDLEAVFCRGELVYRRGGDPLSSGSTDSALP